MGDRGNIAIKDETGGQVWLYTHYDGWKLPETLRSALARRERWDDAPYLARIVFCEMVAADLGGTTGYGISTERGDENHPPLLVDVPAQTVEVNGEIQSFDQYISAPRDWDADGGITE